MGSLFAVGMGLACYFSLANRFGRAHPSTLFVLMWITIVALHAVIPLNLYPLRIETALTIVVALIAVTLGSLRVPRRLPRDHSTVHLNVVAFRASAAVLTLGLGYGVWQFRSAVTAALGVDSFDSLDAVQVRQAMIVGGARGGGLGGLLFSLAPLVACLGVLGGARIHKSWFVLLGLAIAATTQTPARIATFTLVATVVPFYLYIRPPRSPRSRSVKAALAASGLLAAVVMYFNLVGTSLGKTQSLSQKLGTNSVPEFLLSPLIYLIGGVSAFSRAQSTGIDPVAGEHGRSIFSILRVMLALGLVDHKPQSIAGSVDIPIRFNVYTGFGDVWFDFGFIGVFLGFLLLGLVVAKAHGYATRGRLEWAWIAAVLISVMLSTPMAIRLLSLDILTNILVGVVVFGIVGRRSQIMRNPVRGSNGVRGQKFLSRGRPSSAIGRSRIGINEDQEHMTGS